MNRFDAISPLDFRYYGGNADLFKKLSPYLSEEAFVRYQARVEAALARALADRGVCTKAQADEIERAAKEVTADEVAQEDARIKHNTRALVNCIRNKISDGAKPFVHLTATSFDIVDTANALRYKEFVREVFVPEAIGLQRALIALALREKETLQIGRTHGQHAVPITFGYAIAGYVDRLGNALERVEAAAQDLRGQLSGAVGSHNAQALFFEDPEAFEEEMLALLELRPARHSTQVVEAEYTLALLHAIVALHGVLANLADDMRHLQRSEIGEIAEQFGKDQVGSSTMPHKRNPWNFENIKSLWKETMPRIMTHYMDQICEHQRDLSNSASARFIPEMFALVVESIIRMHAIMDRLVVDKDNIAKNFAQSREMIIAEAIYILLAAVGHPDAHEYVRVKTVESQKSGTPLRELVLADASIQAYLDKMSDAQKRVIANPETYTGVCARKTQSICEHWRKKHG